MSKKNKDLQRVTAQLVALSRDENGRVDEARVRAVLAELDKAFSPKDLRPLLENFYAAIARELRFSEARIAFAGTLPAETATALAAHFSKLYQRDISPVLVDEPALLGGLRVQVGDDVYDASLAGTLKKLRASLAA